MTKCRACSLNKNRRFVVLFRGKIDVNQNKFLLLLSMFFSSQQLRNLAKERRQIAPRCTMGLVPSLFLKRRRTKKEAAWLEVLASTAVL